MGRGFLRLVLDADVVVSAVHSDRGASRQLLIGALDQLFEVLASLPLILEYEAVLTRPEHLRASGLTAHDVSEVLDAFVKVATPVRLHFFWRPRLKDTSDEMVLETAVNGGAGGLVTFNTRHFAGADREFGVRVMRPRDAFREIGRNEKK